MLPKQREMDSIVRRIYSEMASQEHLSSTVLVLLGDHGMTDGGNHGGSAPGETSPALVFMSPKFSAAFPGNQSPLATPPRPFQYHTTVKQLDLVPTISALLGLPIPRNSMGILIPTFPPIVARQCVYTPEKVAELTLSGSDQIRVLRSNAEQLVTILQTTYDTGFLSSNLDPNPCVTNDTRLDELRCLWYAINSTTNSKPSTNVAHEVILLQKARTPQRILTRT